ncbi:MAG: flagellar assembly peptidoglycan hydrolase FlgJ [Burkholderiaceae bacterium]|nr:flagellar assembly peptidoglycan hydrolase FlgJ [Burkholderiaceae bacterium]
MTLGQPTSLSGVLAGTVNGSGAAASTLDNRALAALRNSASRDPKAVIRETARQFETLFMQQLMKGMREAQASMSSGMLDNSGTKLGTEMLDSEYAKQMSGAPGGLADVIARQLERQMGAKLPGTLPPAVNPTGVAPAGSTPAATAPLSSLGSPGGGHQADFVQRHTEAARAAEAQTGIPAGYMVAQAAHESGWGRREIRNADGSNSFNVFGIKAGAGWNGPVATVTTTEYIDGAPRKVTAKFRAYDSYEASFNDYARLMKESPRYGQVMADASAGTVTAAGFAQGLQRAGYATDPAYADKLTRVINTTLRLQRVMTT